MNGIKCRQITSAIFVIVFLSGVMIEAAELSWKNIGTSGDFFTAGNWTNDITGLTATNPPASGDKITMGAGNYTATQDVSYAPGLMTVGSGATLEVLGSILDWSPDVAGFTNSGAIRFASGGSQKWNCWSPSKQGHVIYTPGVVEVDGSTVDLFCRFRTFDNTGGAWNVINGGTFIWDRVFFLNNGNINIESNSTITCTGNNIQLTFDDVAFTNAGAMYFLQNDASTAAGHTQIIGPYFRVSSVFVNSGMICLTNSSTGVRSADTRLRVYQSSTLYNSGTIELVNIGTTNEFHKGYIVSDLSITNAGSILVSKGATAGDTFLQVTASGSTYIQTAGSIRLEGGADIMLPTDEIATIDGGTIGGDGSIDEKLQVAAAAGVAFTLRGSADYDVLTVAKTVQLNSGAEVQVTLDGFIPDDTDTFDVLVATGGFVSTDASTLVPVGTLPSERIWKVEIVGETAPQTLRLSVQAPPRGTVILIN